MGGIKLPLLISNDVRVEGIRRGCVHIDDIKSSAVEIGFASTKGIKRSGGSLILGNEGLIHFHGTACMGAGTSIRVDRGILEIGEGFISGNNCFFSCTKGINIGDGVLLAWNINIRDSDGHIVYYNGESVPSLKPVHIGNHVWIAACVDILKGAVIPDGCVVGYRSCLTKAFERKRSLIAGYPAKIVRDNVDWER